LHAVALGVTGWVDLQDSRIFPSLPGCYSAVGSGYGCHQRRISGIFSSNLIEWLIEKTLDNDH